MRIAVRILLLACFTLLSGACGRKGPLIYPDMMIPAAPTAVSARQSGSSIRLQFSLPDKDRAGRPVQSLSGVKVTKKISIGDDKSACSACMTDYALFKTVYLDLLTADIQRHGSLMVLLDSDVLPGNSYSYGITPFTADGTDGALSVSTTAKMVAEISAPLLSVEAYPTEVILKADLPLLPSERLFGMNFYRWQENGVRSFQPLNREIHKGKEYVDRTLQRGIRYVFAATKLVELDGGIIVESAESITVTGMLKDDE